MTEKDTTNVDIHRSASIIDENSLISTNHGEKDTFVVYDGQIGIGGSRITHGNAAWNTNLYYPETKDDKKVQVDDGGQLFDNGEEIVVHPYFTESTRPKMIWEAIISDEDYDLAKIRKEIRRNTGQLLANITGRNVLAQHKDGTEDRFLPQEL